MRHGLRARHHGVVVMCAVTAMLALAGCGSLGPLSGAATKTPAPRATTTPKPALDWRAVTLPTPFDNRTTGIAVSPANGSIAWLCAPTTGTKGYQVWRTTDAGTTWVKVSYLTPSTSQAVSSCVPVANQSDAQAVAINFSWGDANAPVGAPHGTKSYYSTDGGYNWSALPQDIWVDQVVTYGAATYAEIADTSQHSQISLIISDNHLATWETVRTPGHDTSADFLFWAASAPGELLWTSMNGGGAYTTTYSASGNAWKQVMPPANGAGLQVTLAVWQAAQAASFPSNGWLICGYVQQVGVQNSAVNVCTRDGGTTWTTFPSLKNTWECGHCSQTGGASSGVNPCLASAISDSGALYAVCGHDPQDSGTPWAPWTVSRIASGGSAWTMLGQTPTACVDITVTSTGQAWCFNTLKGATTAYVLDTLP